MGRGPHRSSCPAVRGIQRPRTARHPPSGASLVPRVGSVVVSNTIGLSALLLAVANWRTSRGNRSDVRIEHNGVTVTVTSAEPQQIAQLVRTLTGEPPAVSGPDDPSTPATADGAPPRG
ncbi:hypothetical protein ACIQ6Y_32590 [Streptomyces sp. NPDC096205]|uniref:effector-associated constant component EACC1 n=1 Tax=Streptomyces sp. NPDC096205 TaxID=3366081 RepID=UPI003828BA0E